MSVKNIQAEIELLEKMIADHSRDTEVLKCKLQKLKFLAFEEEYREDDNRQLLNE